MTAAQDGAHSLEVIPRLAMYRRIDQMYPKLEKIGGDDAGLGRKCCRHVDNDLARRQSFAQSVRTEYDVACFFPNGANHYHVARASQGGEVFGNHCPSRFEIAHCLLAVVEDVYLMLRHESPNQHAAA